MAEYLLRLYDPEGLALAEIDQAFQLTYALKASEVGLLEVDLSDQLDGLLFFEGDLRRDCRLEVWRTVPGQPPYLDGQCQWLLRRGRQSDGAEGPRTHLWAYHANHILKRRIVAYAAGSSQADKAADFADDLMKEIVAENFLGSATDTTRQITAYLSAEGDLSQGASIAKAFSRRNVLVVLQELAQASALAGTYLAFDVVMSTPSSSQFRTYAGQRGVDRRYTGGQDQPLFGPDYGNVAAASLDYDYSEEATSVYAGGQGLESSRAIGTATDATRIAASPLNLLEYFTDARMTEDATQLADEADAALRERRPRKTFQATLVQTPAATYGLHYGFGDYLTVQFRGQSIDCRLDSVLVKATEQNEQIEAILRADL